MEIAAKAEAQVRNPKTTVKAGKHPGDYKPDMTMSMTQRVAHFLDWAATNRPKEFIPHNEVLKFVQGYKAMPRLANREVELIKSAMTRARKVLHEKYNRGLLSKPSVGVRATTDDLDRAKHELTKRARDVVRTSTRFKEVHSSIDAQKIPQTAEGKLWAGWVQGGAKEMVKQFADPNFERKLLPPAPSTPVEDPSKK